MGQVEEGGGPGPPVERMLPASGREQPSGFCEVKNIISDHARKINNLSGFEGCRNSSSIVVHGSGFEECGKRMPTLLN